MRITSVKLRNFKRFTDLEIKDIPETSRLVVVVGPNGCGKSSLFDAFIQWFRWRSGSGLGIELAYHQKDKSQPLQWAEDVQITVAGEVPSGRSSLYLRTAYRNDPDFAVNIIQHQGRADQELRLNRIIENDAAVANNYHRLLYETMSSIYDSSNDSKSVAALREELIGNIRTSMKAVFGDLTLDNISDPLGGGAFTFSKGAVSGYGYRNLSGGEKSAFDLLLDMHLKKKVFQDAIYCIDEIEAHLHTRVQGTLIRELMAILPSNSQLWVTTHSLGVLRAAQEMERADPSSVCVIDFDPVNPDEPRALSPSSLDRLTWEKMLSIALDDLSPRVAPEILVVCEGSAVGNRRKDFDAEIYDRILGSRAPGILFISGGASSQVAASGVTIRHAMGEILPNSKVVPLCDRDDKSKEEVDEFEERGGIVLTRRNLESYLFEIEVIEALVVRENKQDRLAEAIKIVEEERAASVGRGNPEDDLKSAAGTIFNRLRKLLQLTRCGNSVDTFMRDTLAPLIIPEMEVYRELKLSILDRARGAVGV
ncbi:ATP-binding protein [Bradyrhizobium sp. LjRoot220]|uniref:AAA family ATPase n=1 Tax=Bradyrhizobium sp. LjRoot220 TaxID=3342284 RepID=UPI003ED16AE0